MAAAKVPTRDRGKLAKALARLEAHVSIDCVRVPLLIEAQADHLGTVGAVFEQDITETNDLLIGLEGKLKHSLLGAVLEPATREVAEIAIAQLRHDLLAQRRYPGNLLRFERDDSHRRRRIRVFSEVCASRGEDFSTLEERDPQGSRGRSYLPCRC